MALAVKNLGETEPVVVSPENDGTAGELPSGTGVYAVYDKGGELQFIGLSRNIAASVSAHRKSVPELCCSIKVWLSVLWFFVFSFSLGQMQCCCDWSQLFFLMVFVSKFFL